MSLSMVLLLADGDAHPGHGSSSRHYSENSRNFRTTRLAFPFCQRTRRFSTRKKTGAAERTKQRKKITLLTVYSVLTVWLQYTGSKNAFSCRPQPRNLIFSWRRCVYVFWGLLLEFQNIICVVELTFLLGGLLFAVLLGIMMDLPRKGDSEVGSWDVVRAGIVTAFVEDLSTRPSRVFSFTTTLLSRLKLNGRK